MFHNAAFHIYVLLDETDKQTNGMHCLSCFLLILFNNRSHKLGIPSVTHSSIGPHTAYHFLPKKQEGKTLLSRTILTRHFPSIFQQCTYQIFLISAKKKKGKKIKKIHTGKLTALSDQITNQSITFYPNLTSKGNFCSDKLMERTR